MPRDNPDPEDPMSLTGVEVPADEADVVEMARTFAEEFARSGWDEARIAEMFSSPRFAGPHMAFQQLGEKRVRALIEEALRPWRDIRA